MKTRLTELLGIKYPIIAGGLQHLSTAEFAAAVSNAGGLGVMVSASFTGPEELRKEIRKARALTGKPLAVNLSLFPSGRPVPNAEFVRVIVEEKIAAVETSGHGSPEEFVPALKQGGVKIIHKCAAARHAMKAEKIGADAVAVVGFENGGALGMDDIPTMVLVPLTVERVKIPVIAGGGIADGRSMAAALALGAEGVVIGTRLMATKECPAHQRFKEWMLSAGENDVVVVERAIKRTHRSMKNRTTDRILEMEAAGAGLEQFLPLISGESNRNAVIGGDLDAGLAYCGITVGLVHDIPTVNELMDRIVSEAAAASARLGRIASA